MKWSWKRSKQFPTRASKHSTVGPIKAKESHPQIKLQIKPPAEAIKSKKKKSDTSLKQKEKFKKKSSSYKPIVQSPAGDEHKIRFKYAERFKPSVVGPGYPQSAFVYANKEEAREIQNAKEYIQTLKGSNPQRSERRNQKILNPMSKNEFEEYCNRLGIQVYEPENSIKDHFEESKIDLEGFDLYLKDIITERNEIVKILRILPTTGPVDIELVNELSISIGRIGRSCYFSGPSTHSKCDDIVEIMCWFLSKGNFPLIFHLKVLQSLSLILHSSTFFKRQAAFCGGIRILNRLMQVGMVCSSLLASWSCYVITMAAIGSQFVIKELTLMENMEEAISELTFEMYWYHWPTNFAFILQAIVFGPSEIDLKEKPYFREIDGDPNASE